MQCISENGCYKNNRHKKDLKYTKKKCLSREIELVRKLQHDNIIKIYKVIEENPYVRIMQYFTSRDDLLQKNKTKK
uniref:Protein kinase domain-containing protein n=1 Tax=Elaeophora elaphi TaxID=1147741 RepID=A0A0R3RTN5_9BILA